jgi:hypothetical protein
VTRDEALALEVDALVRVTGWQCGCRIQHDGRAAWRRMSDLGTAEVFTCRGSMTTTLDRLEVVNP